MAPEHEICFEAATKGINRDFYGIGSVYYEGANVAFADGATRFLSENIDPKELKAMLTKSATPDSDSKATKERTSSCNEPFRRQLVKAWLCTVS